MANKKRVLLGLIRTDRDSEVAEYFNENRADRIIYTKSSYDNWLKEQFEKRPL